jgi:hypothetical protein
MKRGKGVSLCQSSFGSAVGPWRSWPQSVKLAWILFSFLQWAKVFL